MQSDCPDNFSLRNIDKSSVIWYYNELVMIGTMIDIYVLKQCWTEIKLPMIFDFLCLKAHFKGVSQNILIDKQCTIEFVQVSLYVMLRG